MAKFELYLNKETESFEIHDECCKNHHHHQEPHLELIDSIETELSIQDAFKRYLMAYPQRKVVLSECCRRK